MTLFISVVSHKHDDMIVENDTLKNLATEHQVIIKANTPPKPNLKEYCSKAGILLLVGEQTKGFGANNNEVFKHAEEQLNMTSDDYFLVLNPDVEITNQAINELLICAKRDNSPISTINLFRDREFTVYDNSVRRFPSLLNPIKSLLGIKRTDHYDKSGITEPTVVDWAAGSFLLFQAGVYKELDGFDERYFMYYEDVDICRRGSKLKYSVSYYPNIYALHLASFQNRKIFNIHSYYLLISIIMYFFHNRNYFS